jgi:hypothetical protein
LERPLKTEEAGVSVTVLTCIREEVTGSNLGRDSVYPEWGIFSWFYSVSPDECQVNTFKYSTRRPLHILTTDVHNDALISVEAL